MQLGGSFGSHLNVPNIGNQIGGGKPIDDTPRSRGRRQRGQRRVRWLDQQPNGAVPDGMEYEESKTMDLVASNHHSGRVRIDGGYEIVSFPPLTLDVQSTVP